MHGPEVLSDRFDEPVIVGLLQQFAAGARRVALPRLAHVATLAAGRRLRRACSARVMRVPHGRTELAGVAWVTSWGEA